MRGPLLVAMVMPVLVAGCDRVFGLTDIETRTIDGGGGGSDGGDLDANPDGPIAFCMNGTNHDEDDDGLDDACDPCPGMKAPPEGDTDSDSDGIGDLCDPFLSDSCTTRHFFSFDNADDLTLADGWSITNGDLVALQAAGGLSYSRVEGFVFSSTVISTSVHLDEPTGSVSIGSTMTFSGLATTPDTGLGCVYSTVPQVADRRLSIYDYDIVNPMTLVDGSADLVTDIVMKFQNADASTQLICSIDGAAAISPASVGTTATPREVGLGAEDAIARFHWLDVIVLDQCDLNPPR